MASPAPPAPLTLAERLASASAGALLTSLLVTPLDVVKVRMQARPPPPAAPQTIRACCREVFFSAGRVHLCSHHRKQQLRLNSFAAGRPAHYHGTLGAMLNIARSEGAAALWTGLGPTLIMSLPANVIYFVGYEWLKDTLSQRLPDDSMYPALLAGAIARTMSVTVISPIELVRTRMQGAHGAQNRSISAILSSISHHVRSTGPGYLWRGLSATLWRDVPFSAVYWASYETLRHRLLHHDETKSPFFVSFAAGAASGMLAATATTPFDVAKTRRQLTHSPLAMWPTLAHIAQTEGARGLFAGLVPRVAKVAPACAIMISTYEYGKFYFGRV